MNDRFVRLDGASKGLRAVAVANAGAGAAGAANDNRPDAATAVNGHRGLMLALALGTFAIGTEGFMIAAILPEIASAVSVSVPAAGQLVTVFTLVYALSSPLLTALTARLDRRLLLMGAMGAFVLANLVAAVAPGYWSLMGARVLLALAAGLYVPNANALAGTIVPPAQRGRALAIVNGGNTIAVALGVPAGAFVGAHFGWRATFLVVAALSVVTFLFLARGLPRGIAGGPAASLRERFAVIRRPGTLPVLLTTLAWATGAYATFTYVAPFLIASTGIAADQAGMAIALIGVSAAAGVAIGGWANDRYGTRRVHGVTLPVMALTFAGLSAVSLAFAPHALLPLLPLLVLWGASAWGFFPAQLHRVIAVAGPDHAAVGLSLNASFTYLGFAFGAVLGSLVIALASVQWIGAVGAVVVALAAFLSLYSYARAAD